MGLTKTGYKRLIEKRLLHWKLFKESMVNRSLAYYDENAGNRGCHKRLAKIMQIKNTEAWELIRIGLYRRKTGWKRNGGNNGNAS